MSKPIIIKHLTKKPKKFSASNSVFLLCCSVIDNNNGKKNARLLRVKNNSQQPRTLEFSSYIVFTAVRALAGGSNNSFTLHSSSCSICGSSSAHTCVYVFAGLDYSFLTHCTMRCRFAEKRRGKKIRSTTPQCSDEPTMCSIMK